MKNNDLEQYVINITEPFDYTGGLEYDQPNEIVVELLSGESREWYPRIPEHADGNQHLNVGMDLFCAHPVESIKLTDGYHYAVVRTGIKVEMPYGHHMMIGSRSGLGFKKHITAFPGIIDHSYRGEIMVKLYAPVQFSLLAGEKIAQGLIFKSQDYRIIPGVVDANTTRGENGFGSTDALDQNTEDS